MEENEIKKYCKEAEDKVLAAHVVVFRLLNMNKELAIEAMEELCRRRESGNEFNFEEYIERELKASPSPRLTDNERNMFGKLFNINFGKL